MLAMICLTLIAVAGIAAAAVLAIRDEVEMAAIVAFFATLPVIGVVTLSS